MDARTLIAELALEPHPEGGWYRQTFKSAAVADGRAASTAIYFLITEASSSQLHRVDADEVFHHYGGAAVEQLVVDGDTAEVRWIGPDIVAGQRPQAVVPAGAWQGCRVAPGGRWSLLGCTVAPGFEYEGFELADDDAVAALLQRAPDHAELLRALAPTGS